MLLNHRHSEKKGTLLIWMNSPPMKVKLDVDLKADLSSDMLPSRQLIWLVGRSPFLIGDTLLGINESPTQGTFEDDFPFPVWWDMFVPWRVHLQMVVFPLSC